MDRLHCGAKEENVTVASRAIVAVGPGCGGNRREANPTSGLWVKGEGKGGLVRSTIASRERGAEDSAAVARHGPLKRDIDAIS